MRNILKCILLVGSIFITACGEFSYEQRDLDETKSVVIPGYIFSNTKAAWTSSFLNKQLETPNKSDDYKVQAVLAPVQGQKIQIKDGYSFSMNIEGVPIQ
jgi:hypothetical protein